MKRSFVREILEVIGSNTVSFAGGLPDETLFPRELIAKISADVLQHTSTLQYSTSRGITSLRKKIAAYYCTLGLDTTAENIIITTGAQQALDLISRIYFKDGVVVEAPAYLGAINAFSANGCAMTPVSLLKDGINIDGFSEAFSKTKRAYLMCDFQNPTGQRYSLEYRKKLAAIAEYHDGIIVDDGAYMELFFEDRMPLMASFAPANILHVGSFSKILAPGLRIGWIRADEKYLAPILALKERADLHTSTLSQAIADGFLASGALKTHLPKIRSGYMSKCNFLAEKLSLEIPSFSFQKPKGGMFIYGKFNDNVNSRELAFECLKNGAVFVPGGEFYSSEHPTNEARFNFSHPSLEDISRGISIIAKTINA